MFKFENNYEFSCFFNHEAEISQFQFKIQIKQNLSPSEWISFTMDAHTQNGNGATRPQKTYGRKLLGPSDFMNIFGNFEELSVLVLCETNITLPYSGKRIILQGNTSTHLIRLPTTTTSTIIKTTTRKQQKPQCVPPLDPSEWKFPCGLKAKCVDTASSVQCRCEKGHSGDPNFGKECKKAKAGQLLTVGGTSTFPHPYHSDLNNKGSPMYEIVGSDSSTFFGSVFTKPNLKGYSSYSAAVVSMMYSLYINFKIDYTIFIQ